MIQTAFDASDKIKDKRTQLNILSHLMQEVGELATEISIDANFLKRPAGPDGILGEAIDVIACALDIIKKAHPNIEPLYLKEIMAIKCGKWMEKNKEYL